MSAFFEDTGSFVRFFDFSDEATYFGYQPLSGGKVGFVVKRLYPNLFRFKPSRTESGIPDTVALIRIAYIRPKDAEEEIAPDRVPLEIDVMAAPLLEGRIEQGIPEDPDKPIPLEFNREFFFNHSLDSPVDSRGNRLTGRQILDQVYRRHCATTRPREGRDIRFRLRLRSTAARLLAYSIRIVRFVLEVMLGRELRSEKTLVPEFRAREKPELQIAKGDSLKILNYEVPKRLIVTFSCVVLLVYTLFFFILDQEGAAYLLVKGVVANAFLSATGGIFLLFVMDFALPKCLFWLLNRIIRLRNRLLIKRIEF